ncbi:MAG: FIST C-terminal domain-containing protein [Acidiferrobacter sp.]
MDSIRVATGLGRGPRPQPDLAATAVSQALARAGLTSARSVILFLTHHFASDPQPALRAAARAAGCTQIVGCTAAGLLTDEEWILDAPAAAAMVLGGTTFLDHVQKNDDGVVLSLAAPTELGADWLDANFRRIGAVAGDIMGRGPFRVWGAGHVRELGYTEATLRGVHGTLGASQGVRALTSPIEVAEVHDYDVLKLGHYPALNVLVQSLPIGVREMDRIPLHLIMGGVTFGDPTTAIKDGRYRLNHIVAANLNEQSITFAQRLTRGERLFWAMRDTLAAERDMRATIERTAHELEGAPDFALLFPCMGRGPHFYGDTDRDLDLLKHQFPGLPIIGVYGNGEIGPLDDANHLYQYSAVLGLFRGKPQRPF